MSIVWPGVLTNNTDKFAVKGSCAQLSLSRCPAANLALCSKLRIFEPCMLNSNLIFEKSIRRNSNIRIFVATLVLGLKDSTANQGCPHCLVKAADHHDMTKPVSFYNKGDVARSLQKMQSVSYNQARSTSHC